MLRLAMLGLAAAAAAGGSPASMTPPPMPTKWPVPAPWIVDERDRQCIAGQVLPEEATQAGVFLHADGSAELLILATDVPLKRKEEATVDLRLDKLTTPGVTAYGIQVNSVQKGISADVDDAFLDRFAAASRLTVIKDGKEILVIDLRGSARTIAQLKKCVASLPVAPPTIMVPPPPPAPPRKGPAPVKITNAWVDEMDYPARAIKGTVRASVDVDAQGQPSNCTIVQSSGNADLDFAACVLMEDRFVYLPALDAQAHPYASKASQTLVWKLPEDKPPIPAGPAK
jgi:TonB family protein